MTKRNETRDLSYGCRFYGPITRTLVFHKPLSSSRGQGFSFSSTPFPSSMPFCLAMRMIETRDGKTERKRERETFVWRGLPDIFIESRRSPATILLDFFFPFFFFVEKQWSLETMSNDSTILRTERWRIYNFNGVYSSFIIRGTRVTLKSEVKTIILNCDTCWIDIGIFIEIMKRLSNYCLLSLSERGIDRKSFSYSWQLADEVVVRSWIGNYDLRWMRFNEISICSGATSIIHYTTNWNLNSGRRLESRKKKR